MAQLWSNHNTIFTAKPSPLATFISIIVLCILGFYTLHYVHSPSPLSSSQNALRFHQTFLSAASNDTVATYLRHLTMHPHVAGTQPSNETANYVLSHFKGLGLDAHSVPYKALLSYPTHSSLSLHFSNGTRADLPLSEWGGTRKIGVDGVVRPYHAYSPSGAVSHAKAVFVNLGRDEDYRLLGRVGVNVSGCVVLARRGNLPRFAVVEKAAAHGAAAVLLYTEGGGSGYRFRKGFERGTVMSGVGDPLSPGWAGVSGGESLSVDDADVSRRFPKIPSMPLSSEAAETILVSLGRAPVPAQWRKSVTSKVRRVGPGPTMVDFNYQGEKKVATIHDVFAVIRGLEEPDRYVLLGNHRDAWTYGAVDPNSGTAALLDIARRFARMRDLGWTPRRTLVFCSWDAEEFGMIGSTEWVEQNLGNLGSRAVAYLNVDCAVQGPGFNAGATPQLDNLLLEVLKKVKDPDLEGSTLYRNWADRDSQNVITRLGRVDSDFAAFVQHSGIPSIDLYYGRDFPVYHTAFDSYEWMTNYGDPLFQRHVAVAGVWGLLALRLADDSILPFNYCSYAEQLKGHTELLSKFLDGIGYLSPLTTSIQEFASVAKEIEIEIEAQMLREQESSTSELVTLKKRALNDRLMLTERGFLDTDGLDGKRWFKHLIYGPTNDLESELDFFPGIADAKLRSAGMNLRQRQALIQHEIWRVARAVQRATSALRGELS
ncbi:probable glutamate carboxypeptidase AMP1 [Humulus lupulus]|uniref:probable glutamate carboxypeptidase AMP1 n=1 Tax=Humulus lupulus TaxID=3486 RepID=UPI002B402F17|nr:probable glutamate carboxypeptidase AMP1 [Humulus lupulus]